MESINVTLFGVFLLAVLAGAIYCRGVFAKASTNDEGASKASVINAAGGVFAVAVICASISLFL